MRNNKQKGLPTIYNNLAECHINLDQFEQARSYLDKVSAFENRNWSNTAKTLQQYAILHEKMGNLSRSIEYYKQYDEARDSAFSIKLASNLKQLEQNYVLKQQEAGFQYLNQRYKLQNWLVLALVGASLLLAGLFAAYFQFYQDKKRHNKELESKVRERTASLEKSNEELQKFAFIASHDLKSPLRNIYGFLSLIKRRWTDSKHPKEDMQFIDHALDATQKMHTLIEDVLEYSRLEYLDAKIESIHLGDLIKEIVADLRNSQVYPGSEIRLRGSFPTIMGNPVLFKQLFTNLIDNGLKYNESDPKTITISTDISLGKLILSVSDNGIGIPAEYRDKVFGIFKRLHASEQFEGTGIGLAICKKIADYYHGEIRIKGNQPKGTIFQFILPAEMVSSPMRFPDKAQVSLLH